jgi:hypothetical protein
MKKIKGSRFAISILVILFAVSLSNCNVHVGTRKATVKAKKIPPGQAKKINGDRGAKRYAPGQNK